MSAIQIGTGACIDEIVAVRRNMTVGGSVTVTSTSVFIAGMFATMF